MTQLNKFEDLNGRFVSLETGMTQSNKFSDWPFYSYKNVLNFPQAGVGTRVGPRATSSLHFLALSLQIRL